VLIESASGTPEIENSKFFHKQTPPINGTPHLALAESSGLFEALLSRPNATVNANFQVHHCAAPLTFHARGECFRCRLHCGSAQIAGGNVTWNM
jgi:hypothetical protein